MRAPVCSILETTSPPRSAEVEHQRVAGRAQRRVDLVGAGGDLVGHVRAGVGERVGELLRAAGHGLDGDGGLLREALRDLIEPRAHHLLQAAGEIGELVVHVLGLEVEAGGQPVAGRGDGRGGVVAGGFQPVEQSRAALAQGVDHGIAGMAERQRDVFALFGERAGDALRHFVDLVGDQIADRGDVVGEIEMHAGDGVAHLFGLADQGLALVGQFAAADRGCALRCRYRRARARTLRCAPALPARRRAPARVRRRRPWRRLRGGWPGRRVTIDSRAEVSGCGQTHGDFGHGFGDHAHVLRAAEHVGEHVEEDHRHDDRAGDADERGEADARGREQRLQFAAVEIGGGEAAGGPGEGGDAGDDIRRARRTAAQRLQDLADIGAVVIGGAARRMSSSVQSGACGSSWNRSAAAGGVGAWRRRRLIQTTRLGADRPGGCRAPPGWRRAPLPSGLWIFADCSPFRSSPRCYAGLLPRPANRHGQRAAPRAREPPDGAEKLSARAPFYPQAFILSPWQCERNRSGKEFFIIVN